MISAKMNKKKKEKQGARGWGEEGGGGGLRYLQQKALLVLGPFHMVALLLLRTLHKAGINAER